MPPSPESPFADLIGIELLEASPERAVAALTLERRHCNSHGIAHGGALFTLADNAFGSAQNSAGAPFVAMDMNIRYLRPARAGQRLTAVATRVQHGRQTSYYRIDITDEAQRLIACVTGTGHLFAK